MRIILSNQFKNEGLRIVEWLEYHRDRGVRDFILVDDHSTDDSIEKINAVKGIRTKIFSSALPALSFMSSRDTEIYRGDNRFSLSQAVNFGAVFEYVKRHYDPNTVLGFFDCDEFLFPGVGQELLPVLVAKHIRDYAVMSVSSFEVDSRRFHVTNGPVLAQTTRSMSVKSRSLCTRNFVVKSFINFSSPNLKYAFSSDLNDYWSRVHLCGMPLKTKKTHASVFLRNLKNRWDHYLLGKKREFTVLDANFVPFQENDSFAIPHIYLRLEPKILMFLHYRFPTYDLNHNESLLDQDY